MGYLGYIFSKKRHLAQIFYIRAVLYKNEGGIRGNFDPHPPSISCPPPNYEYPDRSPPPPPPIIINYDPNFSFFKTSLPLLQILNYYSPSPPPPPPRNFLKWNSPCVQSYRDYTIMQEVLPCGKSQDFSLLQTSSPRHSIAFLNNTRLVIKNLPYDSRGICHILVPGISRGEDREAEISRERGIFDSLTHLSIIAEGLRFCFQRDDRFPSSKFFINPFMPGDLLYSYRQDPSYSGFVFKGMIAFLLLSCFLLTLSCLEIYATSVVWTCHTFENNFGMKHKFAKYLKESCR